MITVPSSFRLVAATGLHRGDRPYQQDQVEVIPHPRAPGCLLAVVADGMGGKSGGRKAADQVILTARQVFERYEPGLESSESLMTQLVQEAHLMIKLTALAFEEEPHSTVGAFLINPDMSACVGHAGDTRIYHFHGPEMITRTEDHSYVQRLVNEGQISEDEANVPPPANPLTV